jgi:hypothetical protein
MHSHPAYVAYVFNPYTAKSVSVDGTEVSLERKPGDVFYSGPVTHKIANTGKTPDSQSHRGTERSSALTVVHKAVLECR